LPEAATADAAATKRLELGRISLARWSGSSALMIVRPNRRTIISL
jgi:hypothetical protein